MSGGGHAIPFIVIILRRAPTDKTSVSLNFANYNASPGQGSNQPNRDQVQAFESVLEGVIESYRQLGIAVSNVQANNQNVINQKLNLIVGGLRELDAAKTGLGDLQVPFEVVQYVDQGLNPQSYTKDCMEKAIQKNEEVKGKIDAFKKFKAHLLVELSKSFPGEMSKFRSLRGENVNDK